MNIVFVELSGPAAAVLFALAFIVLFDWPLEYGIAYTFLRAARGKTLKVKDMFESFRNYWNAVFGSLLTLMIVGLGMAFLIIPGIIFACKLAFVPYLVVEEKMDVIDAVKKSWALTSGYAFRIFLMGVLAIFIALLGLVAFGVGIILSVIWIRLTSASMYYAVTLAKTGASSG